MAKIKVGKNKGFTLVELLVVVVIIGILAAIALPNFIGAQNKAKNASVKGNMRTSQIAAESYATDSGGIYPPAVADAAPYYPGGSSAIGGAAGTYPTNPVDGVANDTPYAATPATTADITALRALSGAQAAGAGTKGQNGYSQVDAGDSYAVTGNDTNNNYILGTNSGVLCLSNQ